MSDEAVVPGFRVIKGEGVAWLARLTHDCFRLHIDLAPGENGLAAVGNFVGALPPLHYKQLCHLQLSQILII